MRVARATDRGLLAAFECSSADSRVEPFVRTDALDRHLCTGYADDVRMLLFFDEGDALVAVALHRRNQRLVHGAMRDIVPGTELVLVAIGDRFRDGRMVDGRPLVAEVLEQTFGDIRSRCRGSMVSMMVQPGNDDGRKLVERLGAELDGIADGDDVFVLILD